MIFEQACLLRRPANHASRHRRPRPVHLQPLRAKATQPDPVESYTSKPLHPRLLAALLGVSRIDRRKTWEHCDRLASQIREGYQEVETLCGQVCLSARDIFRYPYLDVLGFTGRSHEILVDMFGIRLDRAASSGPLHLQCDSGRADPSGMVSLDRQVLDQPLVTKMVVTYGNKPAVEANQDVLELLLQRGEVQEFGICADGVTHFVVLKRGEIEVVICSRG